MYKILAFIGKSGAGKSALSNEICKKDSLWNYKINKIIPATSRPKRENEVEGKDYYFFNDEDFTKKLLNNEFVEATVFKNWGYGTLMSSLKEDCLNIGVFNLEGLECLQDTLGDKLKLIIIYIDASSATRLIRQLSREGNPDVDEILRRYKADEEDFIDINKNFCYYIYVNEKDKKIEDFIDWIEVLPENGQKYINS